MQPPIFDECEKSGLAAYKDVHLITHILRYNRPEGELPSTKPVQSCVLSTVYDQRIGKNRADVNFPNESAHHLFEMCPGQKLLPGPVNLDTFAHALAHDLDNPPPNRPYTHIVLMVMGWNNDQQKAIRSFNSIAGHLIAADHRLHPLVIGLTWPSLWQTGEWMPFAIRPIVLASFFNKAGDADEIGPAQAKPLLRSIFDARGGRSIPIVMIGHSFGARILVESMNATQKESETATPGLKRGDHMILLEGAFDIQRLFDPAHAELLSAVKEDKLQVTITASQHDTATPQAFWTDFAGNIRTFDRICRQSYSSLHGQVSKGIWCEPPVTTRQYGFDLCKQSRTAAELVPQENTQNKLVYFDASRIINCQSPFNHGGAHDDIFRRETANFLVEKGDLLPPVAE